MLYSRSSFVLLSLLFNLILPGLADLKLNQEHVCRKMTQSAFEERMNNCQSSLASECLSDLYQEWDTMMCCEGYAEVDDKCKRKSKNQMLTYET